jgi:hypothetical protein
MRLDGWDSIPSKGENISFFLIYSIKIASGPQPAYPMRTESSFPGGKEAGA